MSASLKLVATSDVVLSYTDGSKGGNWIKEVEKDKEFNRYLRTILQGANWTGVFRINVAGKSRGNNFTQGFRLGSPNQNHHAVEITWQPEKGTQRIKMLLYSPPGVEPIDFHKSIDEALRSLQSQEEQNNMVQDPASENSAQQNDPTSEEVSNTKEIIVDPEEFLRAVIPHATEAGLLSVPLCEDILRERLGAADPAKCLIEYVRNGFLAYRSGSEQFIRVTSEWLEFFSGQPITARDAKTQNRSLTVEQDNIPTSSQEQEKESPPEDFLISSVPETEDIVGKVKYLTEVVRQLEEARRKRETLKARILEYEASISRDLREIEKLDTVLNKPESIAAEKDLASIKAALGLS